MLLELLHRQSKRGHPLASIGLAAGLVFFLEIFFIRSLVRPSTKVSWLFRGLARQPMIRLQDRL